MVVARVVFEENIPLGEDLRINLSATEERRKILKIVVASLFSRRS